MRDDEKLLPIYRTTDIVRAEVIRAALIGEGIDCAIENERQAGFTGVTQVRLHVGERDAEAARTFIRDHEQAAVEEIE